MSNDKKTVKLIDCIDTLDETWPDETNDGFEDSIDELRHTLDDKCIKLEQENAQLREQIGILQELAERYKKERDEVRMSVYKLTPVDPIPEPPPFRQRDRYNAELKAALASERELQRIICDLEAKNLNYGEGGPDLITSEDIAEMKGWNCYDDETGE